MSAAWRRVLGLTYGELAWLAIGSAALAYELWAVATRGGDVLTRAMRANTPRWTAIPVGLGILMGHLTGPRWGVWPYGWTLPFAVLLATAARDFLDGGRVTESFATFLFVLGYALGTLWEGRP